MDGRTFLVRPVGSWVLETGNVVAQGLAVALDKPLEWAIGFFFGNTELSLELWTVIKGISGLMIKCHCLSPGRNEARFREPLREQGSSDGFFPQDIVRAAHS